MSSIPKKSVHDHMNRNNDVLCLMFFLIEGLWKDQAYELFVCCFFVGSFLMTMSMLYLLEYLDMMDTTKDSVKNLLWSNHLSIQIIVFIISLAGELWKVYKGFTIRASFTNQTSQPRPAIHWLRWCGSLEWRLCDKVLVLTKRSLVVTS